MPRRMGARCERQPSRLEMKKLLLTGIAVLLAISAAYAADEELSPQPAVTPSCGFFPLGRGIGCGLRSVSDNRFGAGAGGAGECEVCFAFGFDRGGGTCPGVTTPAGSPLRSMRTAPGLSASR